jgi:hypothetical protein
VLDLIENQSDGESDNEEETVFAVAYAFMTNTGTIMDTGPIVVLDDDFGGDGEYGPAGVDADYHIDSGIPGPGRGTLVPYYPTKGPNERDPIMAMLGTDADGGTMYYFDRNLLRTGRAPSIGHLGRSSGNVSVEYGLCCGFTENAFLPI